MIQYSRMVDTLLWPPGKWVQAGTHTKARISYKLISILTCPHTHVLTDTGPYKYFSLIFLLYISLLPTYVYVYTPCECLVRPEVRGQVRSSGTKVDEPPSRLWESEPASLQKQQLFLTSEPPLQLLALGCLYGTHGS